MQFFKYVTIVSWNREKQLHMYQVSFQLNLNTGVFCAVHSN